MDFVDKKPPSIFNDNKKIVSLFVPPLPTDIERGLKAAIMNDASELDRLKQTYAQRFVMGDRGIYSDSRILDIFSMGDNDVTHLDQTAKRHLRGVNTAALDSSEVSSHLQSFFKEIDLQHLVPAGKPIIV